MNPYPLSQVATLLSLDEDEVRARAVALGFACGGPFSFREVSRLRGATASSSTRAPGQVRSLERRAEVLVARASSIDEDPARWEDAAQLYEKALALDPTSYEALVGLGRIRCEREDDAQAEKLFRRAIEVDQARLEAHYNLAVVHQYRGEDNKAIDGFLVVLRLNHTHSNALYGLALSYENVGRRGKARETWERFLSATGGVRDQEEWRAAARARLSSLRASL